MKTTIFMTTEAATVIITAINTENE